MPRCVQRASIRVAGCIHTALRYSTRERAVRQTPTARPRIAVGVIAALKQAAVGTAMLEQGRAPQTHTLGNRADLQMTATEAKMLAWVDTVATSNRATPIWGQVCGRISTSARVVGKAMGCVQAARLTRIL